MPLRRFPFVTPKLEADKDARRLVWAYPPGSVARFLRNGYPATGTALRRTVLAGWPMLLGSGAAVTGRGRAGLPPLYVGVLCADAGRSFPRTKLECTLESKVECTRVLSQDRSLPLGGPAA
jgi:hypothetical protein